MRKPYWIFGNVETRQALAKCNLSFDDIFRLEDKGFRLLWDSAPSAEEGFEWAEEFGGRSLPEDPHDCGFYRHDCKGCGLFVPVRMYQGVRWSEGRQRNVIFRGYLCDGCSGDEVVFRVKPVKPV